MFFFIPVLSFAQTKDDVITERLIRLEEGQKAINQRLEEGQRAINQRMEGVSERLTDLRNLLYVVLTGMFALVGFVLWDRRTALAPAVKKVDILEKREDRLEGVLREFAAKEPRLAEAFRHAGFL